MVAITGISPDSGRSSSDGITNQTNLTVSGTASAGDTIILESGSSTIGSTTANGSGVWTVGSSFAAGGYNLTAVDNTASATSGVFALNVVTAIPTIPTLGIVDQSAHAVTNGSSDAATSLTLSGHSDNDIFINVLDGSTTISPNGFTADHSGNWSLTISPSDGTHVYSVNASDIAGNTSSDAATISVTIDNTPPAAPVIAGITPDTGRSASDQITNATAITVTGSAEANSTVTLKDGTSVVGSASVDGSGNWQLALSSLAEGSHSLTATATDQVGNTGSASASLVVTIDTTAPAAPSITSLTPDTGASSSDHVTAAHLVTVAGAAEANATVTVKDGTAVLGSVAADGSGAWSFGANLAEGSHSLTAVATDAAGNTGAASAVFTATIDTTPPAAPSLSAVDQASHAVADNATVAASALTLSGSTEANDVVTVSDGSTTLGSVTADGSGAWSFAISHPADGAHVYGAAATDLAGNVGAAADLTVTIDTHVPAAPAITGISPDSGVSASDGLTDTGAITIAGSGEANATITVKDGSSILGSATADGSGAWSFGANLVEGSHALSATATDQAGTSSAASATFTAIIDLTAPAAPTIAGITPDRGVSSSDGITDTGAVTISGHAEANATVTVKDGTDVLGSAAVDGSGAWSFAASLAEGSHGITALATDRAGNSGNASAAFAVTVDLTPPASPSFTAKDQGGAAISEGETLATGTISLAGSTEANAIVTVKDGAASLGTATADGSGAWAFTISGPTGGAHALTAFATDVAGNSGSASAALDLTIDNHTPAAPILSGITPDTGVSASDGLTDTGTVTLAGSAEAGAAVTVSDGSSVLGSATANGSGAWSLALGLAEGTHSLSAIQTDTVGVSSAASNALGVTVDLTPPAVPTLAGITPDTGASAHDNLTDATHLTVTGSAEAGSTVTVKDGSTVLGTAAVNGSGAWSFAAILAEGMHDLSAFATDRAGNSGAASTALAVTVDTTAPAAPSIGATDTMGHTIAGGTSLSDGHVTLSGSGEANASIAVDDGASLLGTVMADGSGAWSIAADLGAGNHSLAAIATDAAGNGGSASTSLALSVQGSGGNVGGGGGGGGSVNTGGGGGGGDTGGGTPTDGAGRIILHLGSDGGLPGLDVHLSFALDLSGSLSSLQLDNLSGDDALTLSGATAHISAAGGHDLIVIPGGVGGSHSFVGFAGDHTVIASSGDNTLLGGIGNNQFSVSGGSNLFAVSFGANLFTATGGNNVMFTGAGSDTVSTSGGSNDIIIGGVGHAVIDAAAGQDMIATGTGTDSINLGGGADIVFAFQGSSTIAGGTGSLLLGIGGGSHEIDLGGGSETIIGGGGNATIGGGSGPELIGLFGTAADVTLGSGQATIFGGSAALTLTVGTGHSLLALAGNSGDVTISNFDAAHLQLILPHEIDGSVFANAGQIPVSHDASGNVVLSFGGGADLHHLTLVGVTQFDASSVAMV